MLAQRYISIVLNGLLIGGTFGSMIAVSVNAQTPSPRSVQPNLTRPVLRVGSQGVEVSELQATLKLLGYYTGEVDGVYAESTAEAVSKFQQAANLPVTGVTNQATWDRLFPPDETSLSSTSAVNNCVCEPSSSVETESQSNTQASFPVLRLGMQGDAVRGLQNRLRARGFLQGQADGIFGPETQAAVIAAQEQFELQPDGVVRSQTWILILQ